MKRVMVVYGGVSTEHEVAVITALQVMNALREGGNEVVPVYITKKGKWVLGDDRFLKPESYKELGEVEGWGKEIEAGNLRGGRFMVKGVWGWREWEEKIEVVFPVFHGKNGEDGTMQGWLNMANLPYVGCGVAASAVAMDKYMSKRVARDIGLKVAEDVLVTRGEWRENKEEILKKIEKTGKKFFIKPSGLGSSIGVVRAEGMAEVEEGVEVALAYDERVVVEREIEGPTEVNISVIGNDPYLVSVTEQPVASGEILSFDDKYLRGAKNGPKGMASAQRLMPARVEKKVISQVEEGAVRFFRAMGGKGIARIDFMMDKNGEVYFNEINPMPGSIAFYLWEKKGIKIVKLVERLIDWAIEDWKERQKLVSTFESNILKGYAGSKLGGVKGSKG